MVSAVACRIEVAQLCRGEVEALRDVVDGCGAGQRGPYGRHPCAGPADVGRAGVAVLGAVDAAPAVDSSLVVNSQFEAQDIGFVSFELAWDDGNWNEGVAF